ncbi:MAG: cytochrome c [Chloroflexi bacterium]|nr:MAG: cytochrome c [Chloroflexota bacterium]MBL1195015.1 cytochrome c [Chloroflexota bacterium]NOH12304.1 cytochrome c [Chloroflexota bacterium]
MKKPLWISVSILLIAFILGACGTQNNADPSTNSSNDTDTGMMNNEGMMRFHMATIPDPYAGLENPIPPDEESIARGQDIYAVNCATCHGDGGMGDGPAGAALDPPPAPVAHTSQMMSDAYMFWRISEGGRDFGTTMISFAGTLTEQDRWDVVNYIRALGSNEVMPIEQFGGQVNDPAIQATQQAEMLSAAVTQEILTQEEADFFATMHPTIDEFIQNNRAELSDTNKPIMESGLDAMIAQSIITDEEGSQFLDIHNRLLDAGLMR